MADTSIEWADAVWNPSTGCSKVSQGCDNCYAERLAERLQRMGQPKYAAGFTFVEHPEALAVPSRQHQPKIYFVNSMSDLFHERATFAFVSAALDQMVAAPRHAYLILTKRPGKATSWINLYCAEHALDALPGHIWLGTSIESNDVAWRADHILDARVAHRFVSAEPLLGPLDLREFLPDTPLHRAMAHQRRTGHPVLTLGALRAWCNVCKRNWDTDRVDPAVEWVITGAESGPNRRPCDLLWVKALRDACAGAGAQFFLKQLQGRAANLMLHAPALDGRQYLEWPASILAHMGRAPAHV